MAHDKYYKLLGINSDAETVVITAAYKALAKNIILTYIQIRLKVKRS